MQRLLAGGVTAMLAAALITVALAAPALATDGQRFEGRSGYDAGPVKVATASCPKGAFTGVYGMGARIVGGGDGSLVLTSMLPSADLMSVTVTARARSWHTGPWQLLAYAVCAASSAPPTVTTGDRKADCPDGTDLTGAGFWLDADIDKNALDALAVDPVDGTVRVHAGGPGTPGALVAAAICKVPTGPLAESVRGASAPDSGWPKSAVATDSVMLRPVYAAGAAVVGAPGLLTALVPDPANHRAVAEAAQAGNGTPARAGGDGTLVVSANAVGTFH